MRYHRIGAVLGPVALAAILAACGPSPTSSPAPIPTGSASNPTGLTLLSTVAIPGLVAGGPFSYDIGAVDATTGHYYLADRTNKSLDMINTSTLAVTEVQGGFTGTNASSSKAGPDGAIPAPGGLVYVGDVNNVKVVNSASAAVVATIPITNSGWRSDEGCYDPDDKLVMMANPADSPPFASWISTTTNTVVATFSFVGSTGLEQCVYDPGTKTFFINNDGTPANPLGELDAFSAASVVAAKPVLAGAFSEGACSPTGLALGLSEQLAVGCDPPSGNPEITQILSATTGAIVKTVSGIGGEDEIAYDPYLKRFYTASRSMTSTGVAGGTLTPVLGVIDAQLLTLLGSVPTGAGSHSVAVDPTNGHVYVPIAPTATSTGGVNVYKLTGGP